MNAVILIRVSSQEQEQGHSLNAQRQRAIDHCARTGLAVLRTFELVESSTRGDRKEFYEMVEFITKQAKPIAVVVDAVDRLQRGFKESLVFDELRYKGVEVHFLRENIVLNADTPPHQLLSWDFATIAAKSYTVSLSANVRRSVAWKISHGELPRRAPVGYLNVADPEDPKKRTVIVDEERAHYVRRLFELYATGAYTIAGLASLMASEGLTNNIAPFRNLSMSRIYGVLNDPFYYGLMRTKGTLVPHKYPPLITKALFDACQAMRTRYHRQPFKYRARPFVFRGILHCAHCGCAVSTDLKKGRYAYLCCTKKRGPCEGKRIREETALSQVEELLRRLRIPEGALERVRVALQKKQKDEQQFRTESVSALQMRHRELQRQLDTLLDMRLRGSITDGDYERKATELREQQREMEHKIQEHTTGDERFGATASTLLELASRAADLFARSNPDEKRTLLNYVCSNLILRGEKLEYTLRRPFDTVLTACTCSDWLPLVHAFRTDLRGTILAMADEIAVAQRLLLGEATTTKA